jgi:hypothetical protein
VADAVDQVGDAGGVPDHRGGLADHVGDAVESEESAAAGFGFVAGDGFADDLAFFGRGALLVRSVIAGAALPAGRARCGRGLVGGGGSGFPMPVDLPVVGL